jgi:tetratricopeptide (TPR) repeat protein
VALREATVGKNFDEIIVDEFDGIPSSDGQRAYLLVAALHRFGIPTRAGLLHRALRLPLKDIGRKVLDPTTKVIIVQQPIGNEDIYYTTRHPVIADIVFDRKIKNERRRREYYEELVKNLDLGYSSDLNAYNKLSRGKNKQLLRDFKDAKDRRSIMNLLIKRNPNDPYVYQHAAMMEISEQDIARAGRHLERAIDLAPDEATIRDTKGRFVLMSAIKETDSFLADQKFAEAEQIFKNNAHNQPEEPYAYKHLAETYLAWAKRQENEDARMNLISLAYEAIHNGLAKCSSTSMLLQKQAEIEQDILQHPDAARKIFAQIFEQRPGDTASRFLAATLEEQQGHPEAALAVLLGGVDSAANDHHLRYRIARLMAEHDAGSDSEIRGHFDAAMLGSIRNVVPRIAYAAYLFSGGDYQAANKRFAELDRVPATRHERNRWYTFNFANIRNRMEGRITSLTYNSGRIEVNQGETEVFFSPLSVKAAVRSNLSIGSRASFNIAFNMKGPIAINLTLCEVPATLESPKTVQLRLLQ